VAEQAARARAEAIEGFAALLRDLRESVGNPSFREMSGRSRAISHTTLHEAAQGHRLPSWATTVEFVKACDDADPGEYRARWEQASRVVRSVSPLGRATASIPVHRPAAGLATHRAGLADRRAIRVAIDPEPAPSPPARDAPANLRTPPPGGVADVAATDDAASVDPAPRARRRLGSAAQGVAAVGMVAAVVVVVVGLVTKSRGETQSRTGRPVAAQFSPADCPVRQSNPPGALPAHRGDASAFIADLTVPDCSHVRHGQIVIKVWRFKNVGTVPWMGYSLHRLDPPQKRNQCQTISDVPVNDTEPGDLVDIRTEITAPKKPGFCFVRFKMMDASGNIAFPGRRPVNFQIIVD